MAPASMPTPHAIFGPNLESMRDFQNPAYAIPYGSTSSMHPFSQIVNRLLTFSQVKFFNNMLKNYKVLKKIKIQIFNNLLKNSQT